MHPQSHQKRQRSNEDDSSNLETKSRTREIEPTLGYSESQNQPYLSKLIPPVRGAVNSAVQPRTEEVCFGMLYNVAARLNWIPEGSQEVSTFRLLGHGSEFIPLKLVVCQKDGLLETEAGQQFAVIDYRTFDCFSNLRSLPGLCSHCVVESAEWDRAAISLAKMNKNPQNMQLIHFHLVLTGPKEMGTSVAKMLAATDLYLQDPIDTRWGLYENPQSLHLSNQHNFEDSELETLLPEELAGSIDITIDEITEEDISPIVEDPDSFLEMMPEHDYLSQIEGDPRIIAKLLSHQQTGVDFINRREKESHVSERSLWDRKLSDDGNEYFQHVITGGKSRSPADCLGGIIADDMGLGKTLTMLSSIVGSIQRSTEFSLGGRNRAKSTIVIVPSELLLNTWANEINKQIYFGTVRMTKYHGPQRHEGELSLANYDIILTTFGTVMVEHRKRTGLLYKLTWYRLVLDEAHVIRNSSSKQFKAVKDISSRSRWCLTGTPIQNSLDDLGSLVKFLRIPVLEEGTTFRKYMTRCRHKNELKTEQYENLRLLLGCICIRRNKSVLPHLDNITDDRRLEFTRQEREQYRGIELAFRKAITLTGGGKCTKTSHHKVMEALLRLRMFCNNGLGKGCPTEMTSSTGSNSEADEVLSIYQQYGQAICSYCSCDITSTSRQLDSDTGYLTACLRLICSECTPQYRTDYYESQPSACSFCHSQHNLHDISPHISDDDRGVSGEPQYPSKILGLVQDVKEHHLRDKCVIFSFWKKTLDIVEKALGERHIKCLRIDGDVPPRKRNGALIDFQSRNTFRVLLMTFSAGSVGLNGLTVANRVHILEPQWNPAVEKQAIGRLLRLDQENPVTVVRYAMRNSIEELVQSKQFRKLELAKEGFTGDSWSSERSTQYMEKLGAIIQVL